MIAIILFTCYLVLFALRWSRWLALAQQKEYRWDRLRVFLSTSEGRHELLRLAPHTQDFSRTGWKRPKLTVRLFVVAVFSLLLLFVCGFLIAQLLSSSNIAQVVTLLLLYVLTPLLVMLAIVPTVLLAKIKTYVTLRSAQVLVRQHQPTIIGITGSYGKTATKHLLTKVLSQKFQVFTTPKSHNTLYSVAKAILSGYHGQPLAVLEYGAYTKGEIARLASWFPPHQAVITGLAPQHLELFGSLEAIVQAKAELVRALPATGKVWYTQKEEKVKRIVDAGLSMMRQDGKATTKLQLIPYASAEEMEALQPRLTNEGRLVVSIADQLIHTQLIGLQYCEAVIACWRIGQSLGVSNEQVADALRNFVPTEQFTRSYRSKQGAIVIDDGGSTNPAGFAASMQLADAVEAKTKILVTAGIVDLGSMSDSIHGALAAQARDFFEHVYYLGSDGRSAFQNVFSSACLTDKQAVLSHLRQCKPETLILLEGRMPGWFTKELA